jgi:hypothetical protein
MQSLVLSSGTMAAWGCGPNFSGSENYFKWNENMDGSMKKWRYCIEFVGTLAVSCDSSFLSVVSSTLKKSNE